MRYFYLIILLFISSAKAAGPIFPKQDPATQREFQELYIEEKTTQQNISTARTESIATSRLDQSSVTLQGNTFNAANKLIKADSSGLISNSAIDTSSVTKLGNGNLAFPGRYTASNQPAFLAYNSATDTNVTGDGTTVTVEFNTEVYDQGNNFAANTFTAPVTGKYLLTTNVTTADTAGGNKCELWIQTTNRTYVTEIWPTSRIPIAISTIADMGASDTALVKLSCSGGALVVDVLGINSTTLGSGMPTYFSGALLN